MDVVSQLAQSLNGRYEIEREIGAGGMATVYLARDIKHRRRVALKVLRPELGAVLGVDRFLAEIQVTANLQHPNLLPLFDSGEASGLLFYVMPFVEGESLRARLDREKQLPVDEAVRLATSIAGALQYAHERGVIHRDLKPENILLQAGQPIIADFGIALAVTNAGGERVTQTGLSLGTPRYMSPEQATGDRAIDARTDVYSLAAMTYEMLSGEPPHGGRTAHAIIARLLTEEVRPLATLRRAVPAHVDGAVRHGLEKLAADRFSSAEAFSLALAGDRPFLIAQPELALAEPPARSIVRRYPYVVAASLAVIALGAVATSVWLATRPAASLPLGRFEVGTPDSVSLFNGGGRKIALSRDGTRLVFVGERSGQIGVYLRKLDDPTAQLIRGSDIPNLTMLTPIFSSDGEWLAIRVGMSIMKIPVAGGTPQRILDSDATVSWSDGGLLVYGHANGLYVGTPDGHPGKRVAVPDTAHGIFAYSWPSVLPGGQYALISLTRTRVGNLADSMELGVVSLKDGSLSRLGILGTNAQYVPSGHIIFGRTPGLLMAAPFSLRSRSVTGPAKVIVENIWIGNGGAIGAAVSDNGIIAYQTGEQGVRNDLLVVTRDGRERRVPADSREYYHPRVSPIDGRIAVSDGMEGVQRGGQYAIDPASGALERLSEREACCAEWTRDGTRLVFVRKEASTSSVVFRAPHVGASDSVAVRNAWPGIVDIVPGPSHGFAAINELPNAAGGDIEIAPLDSLSARRSSLVGPTTDVSATISADGKLLAWASDEGHGPQVYVQPIPGPGARLQVSVGGGREPVWSSKGSTVFYRANGHIVSADVDRTPLRVTKRETLFVDNYLTGTNARNWDVFPGGNEFLMLRAVHADPSRAFAIVNWTQLPALAPPLAPR